MMNDITKDKKCFGPCFSHIGDHKEGWQKNGHTSHSDITQGGDLGDQSKVSQHEETTHWLPCQVTKVELPSRMSTG